MWSRTVPAFRYSPPASTSKALASAPVTLSWFVPSPSSATATPATLTREAVLVPAAIEPTGLVSVTAVGGAFWPLAGA